MEEAPGYEAKYEGDIVFNISQILTTHAMEEADYLCTRIGTCMCEPAVHSDTWKNVTYLSPDLPPFSHTHTHTHTPRNNELWSFALLGHTDSSKDSVWDWL